MNSSKMIIASRCSSGGIHGGVCDALSNQETQIKETSEVMLSSHNEIVFVK